MRSALLMMVVTYPAQLRARSRVMQEGHAMARQVASSNSGTVSRILQAQPLIHFFGAARGTQEKMFKGQAGSLCSLLRNMV